MGELGLLEHRNEIEAGAADDEALLDETFLIFSGAGREYGLAIRHVIEIVALPGITPVPGMPDYVRGVINLRGRVIPAVDVRARLGMDPGADGERTCVVIVQLAEVTVGLVVDAVNEVMRIAPNLIEPAPAFAEARFVGGIARAGEHLKILLNLDGILAPGDLALPDSL